MLRDKINLRLQKKGFCRASSNPLAYRPDILISKNQAMQIVYLKHHDNDVLYIKLHELSWIRN